MRLFAAAQTQWRTSMAGPTGLDYVAVRGVADVIGVDLDAYVLSCLQVIEAEQLTVWAEDTEKRRADRRRG